MAQIVKLRRSSVSGQKPTNTNLQLGELALNTTDGKVFMAVSGSGGPSVQEILTTNASNTGSLNLSGSIGLIGDQVISGSLEVTSSVITPQILNPNGNIDLIPSGGLGGVTLHGDINWVRTPGDPETEIGELIAWTATMGLIEGGGISIVSGLTIQIGEMVGYAMENVPYASHLLLKLNTEGTSAASRQITLPANSSVYVYYTGHNVLTYNAVAPSTRTNVIMGRVITNGTEVIYIDSTPINAHHYSNYLDRLFREAMGSIFASGGIVTENTTPFHLNVTPSVYFFSQNRITTTGATGINMDQFYRQVSGSTYNIVTGSTVDNTHYDDGSGTLATIPTGKFVKHSLYLLGTPTQKYLLVYGQDLHDSYGLAEAAGVPTPPNYFKDAFVLISSIVVSPDESTIHAIIDERPRLSYVSPSKTGVVTEHSDLTGLDHDDHIQYLLVNGDRAMSGDLNMGGNDISNSLSISTNGLTVNGISKITGSFFVSGSTFKVGNNNLVGDNTITGSNTIRGNNELIGDNTITGSNYILGNSIMSGTLKIEGQYPPSAGSQSVSIKGNVDMNGYLRLDPVVSSIDTSISGAYMFVTASTGDLYFSQNIKGYNNTTRLRWLEGNLYSGLLNGGVISATNGGTTFNVASGSGIIVNLNASLTDDPYPTIKNVKWDTFTGQTLTNLTSSIQTFVGIDNNGQILQQPTAFNDGQYNTVITLGTVIHQNKSTVNASITYPNMAYGYKQRTYDFFKAFGPLKLSGLDIITANTLGLNVGSGTAWADGRNYAIDPNNPSYITDSGTAVSKIFRYYHVSGSTFVQDTNNSSGYTSLDVTHYVNNGVLTTVPGNNVNNYEWTNQRVFWYPNSATKGIVVYYGNRTYASVTDAAANAQYEPFIEIENTKQNAVYLGSIAVRKDAVWSDPTTYLVLPSGIFRNVGGSGGGGAIPSARLTDLLDVDVAGATNGDLISYNDASLKWEHGKHLTGSYQITGSLDVSESLIVGSGSLDTISPEKLHVENSGSYNIAHFDGYHYSYAQFNLQNHYSGSSASSDIVITADNGTEDIHYIDLGINSSTYNAGYVGYENDAYLLNAGKDLYVGTIGGSGHPSNLNLFAQNSWENPQIIISGSKQISFNTGSVSNGYEYEFSGSIKADHSLHVVGDITGSNISGSFIGDGSRLYNIPMSGITNLQLSKIVSGSVSASISPDNGLRINTDVYIDGTITAKEIHTDYVTSSVLYQSGSTKFGDSSDDNHNFTGSVKVLGGVNASSLTGSIDYNNLTNVPTLVSGSSQISYSGLTGIPSGIISGSSQILDGSGIWSGSSQLPSGVVSGSSQILDGSGIWSGSAQLPSGIVSGSSQISYGDISNIPNGIISGSSQLPSGIVSGSLQVSEYGYSTTGSNTFVGNQIISGSLTVANTKMGSLCTSVSANGTILDLGGFDGATIDYVIKYDGNRRFGTIMGVWDGAQFQYTETTTMDIGNTNAIGFDIDQTGKLNITVTSNTWDVTLMYRALGC